MCIAVLACAACSSPDGLAGARAYDACAPLAVTAAGASVAQLASIDAALAAWHAVGIAAPVRADDPDALPILFEPSSPELYGYYGDTAIYIRDDLDDAQRPIVIAHELGHALGLVHIAPAQRMSVMNPANLSTAPTDADHAAIVARWGNCTSF